MALTEKLAAIGDAIREKTGSTDKLTLAQMPDAIASIETGGAGWTEEQVVGLFNRTGTTYSIPDGAQQIPTEMFSMMPITQITIPDNITLIGDSAFAYTHITSIDIPDTVTEIYGRVFLSCSQLKVAKLPVNPNYTTIWNSLFASCTSLESISIPQYIQRINGSAFFKCTSLKSITLPASITYIHAEAFSESGLEHIYVPWAEGTVANAPWGATNATIHYNS